MESSTQSSVPNDNLIPRRKRVRITEWSEEHSDKISSFKKTFSEKCTQTQEEKSVENCENVAKFQIYSSLLTKIEPDLECGICKEIYIECCILPCGHIFCSFCIRMWFLNADSCPICRLTTEFIIGTKIIDNFVTKFLAEIDEKMVELRKQMVLDRKNVLHEAESNWVALNNNNHYYPTNEMWQDWLINQANDGEGGGRDDEVDQEERIPSHERASRNLWPWSAESSWENPPDSDIVLHNDHLSIDPNQRPHLQ